MRSLIAVLSLILAGCMTRSECLDAWSDRLNEVQKRGGIAEGCSPDRDVGSIPLGARGEYACYRPDYRLAVPNCSLAEAVRSDADAAICRAVRAFPDEVARLGEAPRVDAYASATEWRVRFATPEAEVHQRGVLVILRAEPDLKPIAILYQLSPEPPIQIYE